MHELRDTKSVVRCQDGEKSLKHQKRRMSQDLKVALDHQREVEGGASMQMQAEVARLSAELKASQAVVIALWSPVK